MIKLEVKNAAVSKLKATQAELEDSQAELEATQAELEDSQAQLEAAQARLEASQVQLEATQVELEDSQAQLQALQAELEATQTGLEASQDQVVQLSELLQELQRQQAKEEIDEESNPSARDDTPAFPAWILLPMRMFLGLTFIYAGIQKLTDPQFFDPSKPGYIGKQILGFAYGSPIHDFLINVAHPHAVLFGWMTALGEIAVGLATYAGFLFRLTAFVGLLLSLTFFLSASWGTYPYFYGADIVFIFCWVTMILGGPLNTGLPSIDDWLVERMLAAGYTPQELHPALQLYILLVAAGAPHKSSWTAGINLLKTNPITSKLLQSHQPSSVQEEQMTRRRIIREYGVGAATVAGITLLGIPLHIYSGDPNQNAAQTNGNTANTISPTSNPDTISTASTSSAISMDNTSSDVSTTSTSSATQTPSATSTPKPSNTASTLCTSTGPIPVKSVSVGQSIAPACAVPKNSSAKFIISSTQDSAILIHLPNGNFVAYDAVCPHAGYTVDYHPDTQLLVCPGHGSVFDPFHNAAVLHGPAHTPLSALGIQIDSATGAIKLKSVPST